MTPIRIDMFHIDKPESFIDARQIDYDNSNHRLWLDRHLNHTLHNGLGLVITPILIQDIEDKD